MGAVELEWNDRVMLTPGNHDVDLIRRVAAGDGEALNALYAAYGQRLYAYALRLTGDPATAEDVVQESLVAAWQGAPRFRGTGRVLTWLLGIVHHKALNALRGALPLPEAPDEEADLLAETPAPDEVTAQREQRQWLRVGLAQLSPEHRAVLELIFYQGLSLKEAAEVCGCPVGTIKSRLNYAKTHLRGILSREGFAVEVIG